jgi:biopolymer transport protein ExbB
MREGRIDWAQAVDYCELNPSPAARVALAAIRRGPVPSQDAERLVALARRVETERMKRGLGTLRRVAALAPLVGLLASLAHAGHVLARQAPGDAFGPVLAPCLTPLTAAVGLAILALLSYDGLSARIDRLSEELESIGLETLEGLAVISARSTMPGRVEPGSYGVPVSKLRGVSSRPAGRRTEPDGG